MSYTNQKVRWEPCSTNPYLIRLQEQLEEANSLEIIGKDYYGLAPSDAETIDVYGDSKVNMYDDVHHPSQFEVLARKQPHVEMIRDANGREVLSRSYFYVDPNIDPNAMHIAYLDKLDGETVAQVYIMCDLLNKPKMVRFITV